MCSYAFILEWPGLNVGALTSPTQNQPQKEIIARIRKDNVECFGGTPSGPTLFTNCFTEAVETSLSCVSEESIVLHEEFREVSFRNQLVMVCRFFLFEMSNKVIFKQFLPYMLVWNVGAFMKQKRNENCLLINPESQN